jgi:putative nucleotidyltransferase with HDIG domain
MNREGRSHDPIDTILAVSRAIGSSLELDKVVSLILKESRKAFDADHASLFLYDEGMKRLVLSGADGFSDDEIDNIRLFGSWEVISEDLVRRKRVIAVDDVHNDGHFKGRKLPFSHERFPIESFMAAPLKKDAKVEGVLIVSNRRRPGHAFTKEDEALLAALSNHIAIAVMNAKLYHGLRGLFISTITSLTRAIDAKDSYTSGHSERVIQYAVAISKEMGLGDEEIENIRLASLLHDVGKIGVKESILMKPAKLLGYERRQIRQHPLIGARIIETIDDSHKIVKGILEHHERYNGKGYPKGLAGDQISLEGRIIAVADTYDALTTDRPYQRHFSHEAAFNKIKHASSTFFDPKVVHAFVSSYTKYPETWKPAS